VRSELTLSVVKKFIFSVNPSIDVKVFDSLASDVFIHDPKALYRGCNIKFLGSTKPVNISTYCECDTVKF